MASRKEPLAWFFSGLVCPACFQHLFYVTNCSIGIGFFFGILLCHFTLDLWVARKSAAGQNQPEQRLPPVAFGGVIIPVGLFIYGWTTENHIHVSI
jgi:hypothetical protein